MTPDQIRQDIEAQENQGIFSVLRDPSTVVVSAKSELPVRSRAVQNNSPVDRALRLAEDQLGTREPEAYAKYAGGRAEPWCGHFVNWLCNAVGATLPEHQTPSTRQGDPMASTTFAFSVLSSRGLMRSTPQPGDLVFYRRIEGGVMSPTKMGHVGIIHTVKPDSFTSIEGNVSDKVSMVSHKLNNPQLAGYARVLSGADAGAGLGTIALYAGVAVLGVLAVRALRK